jgi:PIN domain nuclease of toxin-antitoxin system
MTVIDSQGVLAFFLGEPAAAEVEAILRGRDGIASVSSITMAEVIDVGVRGRSQRVEAMEDRMSALMAGGLEVVAVDEEIARLAGALRSRHWDANLRPVSMADCVILATAMRVHEPVASADRSLIAAARAEGHPVVALLDSHGEATG